GAVNRRCDRRRACRRRHCVVPSGPCVADHGALRREGLPGIPRPRRADSRRGVPLGTQYNNWHPVPTTHVLAYVDATTHRFTPDCKRIADRAITAHVLVGPYPRPVDSRVFCSSSSFAATAEFARYTLLQFRPVLDRKRHTIGTRIIATINATPVLN